MEEMLPLLLRNPWESKSRVSLRMKHPCHGLIGGQVQLLERLVLLRTLM
jgi:hypothetical protein